MIDLHCHILPGVDDGPEGWDDAVRMARVAAADGTRVIVATPHVGAVLLGAVAIRAQVEELNRRLRAGGVAVEVLPGAEVASLVSPDAYRGYALAGSRCVLLEFPLTHLPRDAGETVSRVLSLGLVPLLAHPERNPSVLRDPARLLELLEAGALAQITASSLDGGQGPEVEACARYLVKRGAVHVLASDGHSAVWRPPILSDGVRAAAGIVGEERARRLVEANPESLLAARPVDD